MFAVMGFSFSGAAPNQGLIFASLKPFDERKGDRASAARRVLGAGRADRSFGISGAIVVAVRAAVDSRARARSAASSSRCSIRRGRRHQRAGGGDVRRWSARATQSPGLTGLFSSFTANDPQLIVEIDREQALALGLPLSEITSALQIFLGSQYVNDFDFNNRAYRVYVQADQAFRAEPAALEQLYVRNARRPDGAARATWCASQRRRRRRSSATSTCSARRRSTARRRPGFSSGQALQEMERVAAADAAAGHELRVVGAVARGEQGRAAVGRDLRPRRCCSST